MFPNISWTQILVGAFVVPCFYSLYFYFAYTEPLRAEVRQLRVALLAVTQALASEQRELESQELTYAAILTSKARTLAKLQEQCKEAEAKFAQCAEQYLELLSKIRDAESDSAIPEFIRDDESPTQRIDLAESLRLAALSDEVPEAAQDCGELPSLGDGLDQAGTDHLVPQQELPQGPPRLAARA